MSNFPQSYMLVSGIGKAEYPLVAFDNALRDAGIGDYNLVKVSSILPPKCIRKNVIDIKQGSILYAAYAVAMVKDTETASVAVATAVPNVDEENGVIFETTTKDSDAEVQAVKMCKIAMKNRNRSIQKIESSSINVEGKQGTCVCGISALVMW